MTVVVVQICRRCSPVLGLWTIVHTSESLISTAHIATVQVAFNDLPFFPYRLKFGANNLHFSHSADHVRNLKMRTRLGTEVFGLRPVVSLPPFAKRMIHPVVSEIVVLKVEIVEVVAARLYFLAMHHPNQLGICLLVGYFDVDAVFYLPSATH